MNREIKFRAWDNDKQKFISGLVMHVSGAKIWQQTMAGKGVEFAYPNVSLQQFTGLKDKNGKEIYEGDIVKVGDDQIVIRNFIEDTYHLHSLQRAEWEAMTDISEVIGTIYENPSLLK